MIYDSFSVFLFRIENGAKKLKPHSFRILVRNPSFNLLFVLTPDDFSRGPPHHNFCVFLLREGQKWSTKRPRVFRACVQKQHINLSPRKKKAMEADLSSCLAKLT